MGFAIATGLCIGCRQPFAFNPVRVPSAVVNGTREPICRTCVERVNPLREEKGLPPIEILPDAYAPCDENEL